ncbi:hypothetical protein [Saccharopolyspora hattusasensis]|uniref:hypothetical protein n=1 Tax=Saccharopolyspora hattusasensis TaxID=1128679 RepID=UPI003D96E970
MDWIRSHRWVWVAVKSCAVSCQEWWVMPRRVSPAVVSASSALLGSTTPTTGWCSVSAGSSASPSPAPMSSSRWGLCCR